jgi:prepilin-type N-terminal cleavage/methylation domain-containing protein
MKPLLKFSRAFTLIELLVVVAISALFSTLAITYSHVGQNEVALAVEESKIAQFILQAKSLAIATYKNSSLVCGYGFVVNAGSNPQTYSIFAYTPALGQRFPAGPLPCPAVIGKIFPGDESSSTPGTWQVAVSPGVKIEVGQPNTLNTVIFSPPDPTTYLSENNVNVIFPPRTLNIYLQTTDGKNSATISVNPEGQVSF